MKNEGRAKGGAGAGALYALAIVSSRREIDKDSSGL